MDNKISQVVNCDLKDIANSFFSYFNRPDNYKIELRVAIRDYALQKYDWGNAINKFFDVYEEILVDKKR